MRLLARSYFLHFLLWLAVSIIKVHGQVLPYDSVRLTNMLKLAERSLVGSDTTQVGQIARRVLAESRQTGYQKGVAISYLFLERLKSNQGQYAAALLFSQQAEHIFLSLLHTQPKSVLLLHHLSQAAHKAASAERGLGNREASIVAFLRAIDYAKQANSYDDLLLTYNNVSQVFFELRQIDKAQHYLNLAIALSGKPLREPQYLLLPYLQSAMLLIEQHNLQEAWKNLLKARQLLAFPRAVIHRSHYEYTLGIYFFEAGLYRQAQASFGRALSLVEKNGNAGRMADLAFALARTTNALGDNASTLAQLSRCLTIAKTSHNRQVEAQALEMLANLAEARGPNHAPTALVYLKQYQAIQNQLKEEETKRNVLTLETKYHTREQQQQIRALHAQRQIQQQTLERKTLLSYATSVVAVLLLCTSGLAYRTIRVNRELTAKKLALQASRVSELESERLRVATEAMLHGQDEERSRIARDLHDGLGGRLTAAKHYLSAVHSSAALPEASTQFLSSSLLQLDTAISELRQVANDMMPEALQRFGLVAALQDLCASLSQSQLLQVQFQAYGLPDRLPQRLEAVVYRLVQELVNNAMKHAAAHTILVQLVRTNDILQLVVEDDGRGFTPANARAGVGLRSIQSRVDYLRGTLDWHSQPGQGTTATIEFPVLDA